MERYTRNELLRGVGSDGQAKLREARVLIVGAGGLGSPVAYYLAAAGVGTLGIMDADHVELSNLNRQILHGEDRLGEPKVESAKATLGGFNPSVAINTYPFLLTAQNARELFQQYDLVVDCVDSFEAKFLINDTAVAIGKPFVHCGVVGWGGQLFTHLPGEACLRCLIPEPPKGGPESTRDGILGAVAGAMGSLQAAEAVKVLTGAGQPLTRQILFVDLFEGRFSPVAFKRNPRCPLCGSI